MSRNGFLYGTRENRFKLFKAAEVENNTGCAAYIFAANHNDTLPSDQCFVDKGSLEMDWIYEYSFVLGFRTYLGFTPLSIRQPNYVLNEYRLA